MLEEALRWRWFPSGHCACRTTRHRQEAMEGPTAQRHCWARTADPISTQIKGTEVTQNRGILHMDPCDLHLKARQ